MKISLLSISFVFLLPLPDASAKENPHQALVLAAEDIDQGRYAKAEDRLEDVRASSVWTFWRAALLARAKLNQDKPKEAWELLEDMPPPPKDLVNKNQRFYRRLYKEALETGLEAADRLSKPREIWERQLWAYFPDYEGGAATPMPDGVRAEDKVARLHILFEKSLFETIPSLVSPGEIADAEIPADEKCRALFERGFAIQKLKRKEEALEGYQWLENASCEGKILARALYWKGSLESELKRYDAAIETFRLLAKQSGGDGRYQDDAYYRLHQIYRSQNDDQKADRAFKELSELPRGDMKEKVLWEDGFAAYQRKDYVKALDLFERIIQTESLGTEAQPQALYWKARTQEIEEILAKKKRGGPSAATYRRILKTYPFSFYAVLAEARWGESAAVPSLIKSKPGLPGDKALAEAFRVVDELNRKGRRGAAADLLDYLTHLSPAAVKEKPDLVAQRWMEAGDFNRALEMATEHLDKSAFDINLEKDNPLSRALYPLAYPEDVRRAAETNRLPSALILGIMREESLFLKDVHSRAGAVGLMQLMPATARLKARALGIPHSYGDLSDPSSNIVLGSSYLREMMGRFDNQTALAVMAYNAGPGNVSKWLRNQGDLPLDEFIEMTPLTETRGYVNRVLRSAHIYGHLLGQSKRVKLLASLEPPQF